MARRLTKPFVTFGLGSARRRGRYDTWLDGAVWELTRADIGKRWYRCGADEWPKRWRRARVAIRRRARSRGLVVSVQKLADGAIVVQATGWANAVRP